MWFECIHTTHNMNSFQYKWMPHMLLNYNCFTLLIPLRELPLFLPTNNNCLVYMALTMSVSLSESSFGTCVKGVFFVIGFTVLDTFTTVNDLGLCYCYVPWRLFFVWLFLPHVGTVPRKESRSRHQHSTEGRQCCLWSESL